MASFDENGKYIKTNWKAGDKITATKLNKIEESIEAVNDNDISRHVEADARLDALEAKDVAHDKELTNIKNTIADNKAAAELGDYDINSRMTFLEEELNEGIEEVHNVAETVDGKIATAEANMTAQVNQGKADMEAMVAEVEADLEGLHAKDEELSEQLTRKANKIQYNIKDYGAKDNNSICSDAFDLAISDMTNGGELILPQGTYIINRPIVIDKPGIKIKGVGYKTRIIADINFNGDTLIKYRTGDTTLCKGNGLEDVYIDCNGVKAHGLTVYGGYDMSRWINFEIRNVNRAYDGVRFISSDTSNIYISQTIMLENILSMHDTRNVSQEEIDTEFAQGRSFYLQNVQEVMVSNCKGFGLDVLTGTGVSFELDGCRGVTFSNNSFCFNRVGIKISSTNRSCNGIFINGSTVEMLTESFIETSSEENIIDSLYVDGIRVQNSKTKINLNYVNNSVINSGLCDVVLNSTVNNVTVYSLDDTKVTNNGVRCNVIGLTNSNNRGYKIPTIDFTDVYRGNTRVMTLNSSPAVNASGLMIYVNIDGTTSIKHVFVGEANSGGDGYRILRIQN